MKAIFGIPWAQFCSHNDDMIAGLVLCWGGSCEESSVPLRQSPRTSFLLYFAGYVCTVLSSVGSCGAGRDEFVVVRGDQSGFGIPVV